MHYHKPLMDLFRSTLGVGGQRINFYKYSPQRECFVGFDQAYVKTDLSDGTFFRMLRDAAASRNYALTEKFVGYFLQFKVVKEMQQRRKYTPPTIRNRPHYRVSIDTTKNLTTGLSQHELLYNLNQNQGAMVYYACPMLFDRTALYDIDVDLDDLRLADLASCPSAYTDNDNHFIYYNDSQAMPVWSSEPAEGKVITPRDFAAMVTGRLSQLSPEDSARELLQLLTHVDAVGLSPESQALVGVASPTLLPFASDSLTIIRIGAPDSARQTT